ncbi:hypothetical protein NAC44_11925 [Allorhizobium sp. BGMRC 0089]|uniref:hypothetical protein n=1 Tax=Allorhizobium sonneratiae TaxID=2934936 RepID=UPI0020337B26|nr:hypothetical protein [Allorhizobium sonneratiae]MCM2293030.1 hypothetical protein [Allorhizobium sonneratiae]
MTTSTLGFAIDSSQAASAASDLDKLTSSATRAEQAAAKVSGAGTRMSRGFADLNPALEKIIGSLGRLEGFASSIDKRLDAMTSSAVRASKATAVLDQSAVEASTAYKQLEASLIAVTVAQKKAEAAQSGSLAMIEKQKASIASLNAEMAKLRNTPMPVQPNHQRPANSNFQTSNIAAQLFDIGSTAAFMSPTTVGLQQGPQLAQAFAGQSAKQALTGLAAGFAAIASPVSLAAIGLTTAAAAAIQFGSSMISAATQTVKLDDALERHDALLKRIDERYGALTEKTRGFASETANVLGYLSAADVRVLRSATNQAQYDVFQQTGNIVGRVRGGTDGGNDLVVSSTYKPIEDALRRLRAEAKNGRPDFDAFYDSLYKAAAVDPKFAKKADELALLVEKFRQGTKAIQEMDRAQRAIFNDRGPNGMLLSQGTTNTADMGNLALYESRQRIAAQRQRQGFDASVEGINARSPQERAAAARSAAAAQYNNDENPQQRKTRIEQAGTLALIQAEKQLSDAQRDRVMNLDKTLADQQLELDLIGRTGGAAAALRKEYELISQLKMEAARNGTEVDQKEIELIKQKTAEYGKYVDLLNQRKFDTDMAQQASDARLSPIDRQVVSKLRQYGLPEDLSGNNAKLVRQELQSQEQKVAIDQFSSSLANSIIHSGGDIGKAFAQTFLSSLQDVAQKQLSQLLSVVFNSAIGGGTSGASGIGAVGSAVAALGGKAANNNTAGGYSGLASVIPVTRSALPDISANTDVASYIAKAAAQRGIDPTTALAVAKSEGGLSSWNLQSQYFKNGVQEQSYGPFQLYKGGGLGNDFMNKTGLDPALAQNGPAGVDYALDYAKQNGWSAWYGAKKAGIGNWDGINSGGAGTAADAVNKLASASSNAANNLTGFGNGLGQIGSSLMGGSGSAFNWSSLTSPSFQTNSTLSSVLGYSGSSKASSGSGFLGSLFSSIGSLFHFADGTNYAPGGLSIVGERGPELVNLPQGSQVFNTNKSAQMMGGNQQGGKGARSVTVPVSIMGNAYGDSHLQNLISSGVQQGLQAQQIANERGGTGSAWNSWSANKG